AAKLLDMQRKGDILDGDVVISTHICPDAPTKEHYPTPFMDSPFFPGIVSFTKSVEPLLEDNSFTVTSTSP
ncbi:DUF1177 family protein, partial [Clostridioides difficile]